MPPNSFLIDFSSFIVFLALVYFLCGVLLFKLGQYTDSKEYKSLKLALLLKFFVIRFKLLIFKDELVKKLKRRKNDN